MFKDNKIFLIGIAALLIYIIYLQSCQGNGKIERQTIVETIYKFDTVERFYPIYTPTNIFTQLPNETIQIPYLDSNYCKRIAVDYLSTRFYQDTLVNDSVDVYNFAEVTNNKIVKQRTGYRIKFPVTVTNIVQPNRIKFYIGGTLGSDFKNQIYLGPQITLQDKREYLYQIGAGFAALGGPPVVSVGMSFKIKLKRK